MIDDYDSYDATGLAALIESGEVTPDALLDEALARVEKNNSALNAVVLLRETVARRHIEDGLPGGPFRGVPFLLKDLGAEAVDFPSNNGSQLFANTTYSYDSEIYLRIKRSGLVTFGRTTAPELGVGPVTEAQVYDGPTRNPWNLDHTSGGSSGGAAAAVAAGVVPAAHGSDGGGSVRIPASCCGLVGFKPTRARLPDGPAVGEGWAGMAIDGFLTRSVRDTAGLLDATQGPDLGDPYCAPPLRGSFMDAIAKPPDKLRVAYCVSTFVGASVHPECHQAVERGAKLADDIGHDVREIELNVDIAPMMAAWTKIVGCGTALSVRGKASGDGFDEREIEGVTKGALQLAETVSGADYLE
ncbi:MAG: amidase, partial [Methyloligellaceae bacterium]